MTSCVGGDKEAGVHRLTLRTGEETKSQVLLAQFVQRLTMSHRTFCNSTWALAKNGMMTFFTKHTGTYSIHEFV